MATLPPRDASASRRRWRPLLRLVFLLPVLTALLTGVAGGLLRAGVDVQPALPGGWIAPAMLGHAFLMICVFMGTVIGLERAVALKAAWAFAGPLASAVAGLAWLGGADGLARLLALAAGLGFVAVNIKVYALQRAPHTALLLVAAVAWALGLALHAGGAAAGTVVPWWFAFLLLTIAAERLEMTRLMRRRRAAGPALQLIVVVLLAGAALSGGWPRAGGLLYGAALSALAVWLLAFDIARRTVHTEGLSRYMAVCLLLGYGWLLLAGAAWVAAAQGLPFSDMALHALALGFVFSMMLGHAPVILPALARVKLLFTAAWYVPLALLHGSLVLRLAWGHGDAAARAAGAAGNAAAIGLFALTVLGSAIAWRLKHPPEALPPRAAAAASSHETTASS
ncbi:MAG: hypothetical protein LCI02_10860 [Proteobacteria bacterium]|nr:hypothetical protein [Pseudomonadota bacterium]